MPAQMPRNNSVPTNGRVNFIFAASAAGAAGGARQNTSAIKPQRRIERRGNRNRFFPLRSMRSMRFILFGDLQFGLHSAKMKSTRSAISWLVNPSSSPFRHERLYRGMHLRDLRTRDDYLDAEGLTNRDAAGGFVHDQAGVAGPPPGYRRRNQSSSVELRGWCPGY